MVLGAKIGQIDKKCKLIIRNMVIISLDFFVLGRIISLDFFIFGQIISLDYFIFVSLQRELTIKK
jgi:hypothetical protein